MRLGFLGLAVLSPVVPAQADVFWSATELATPSFIYKTTDEVADDVVFSGTRRVTAFSFAYSAAAPVTAVVRFYSFSTVATGGDPFNAAPAEIPLQEFFIRLPVGSGIHRYIIPIDKQFTWKSEPGFYAGASGGYLSLQFLDVNQQPTTEAGWVGVNDISIPLLWNVTAVRSFPTLDNGVWDFQSVLNRPVGSFYLVVEGVAETVPLPEVAGLGLSTPQVRGGQSVKGTVTLDRPAPAAGAWVSLRSDQTGATVPASVFIPSGNTTGVFQVSTTRPRRTISAKISASTATKTVTTLITVTR